MTHIRRIEFSIVVALTFAASSSCDFSDAPVSKGLESVQLSTQVDTADGTRIVTVTAMIDTRTAPAGQLVSFSTTAGQFLPPVSGNNSSQASAQADSTGLATVRLQAPKDSALAVVTATALGMERVDSVRFLPAPPTLIEIALSPAVIAGGAPRSLGISVTLARVSGFPSPGFVVRFAAVNSQHDTLGTMSPDSVLLAGASASTTFFAPVLADGDTIFIMARARRGLAQLTDSTRLLVEP